MGHESQIELWSPNLTTFCFAGFGTDRLRCQEAMKTAGRENPNRRGRVPRNRAHGAEGQNSSRSIRWAEKQEKFQPMEMSFFLTSSFIELTRQVELILKELLPSRPSLGNNCQGARSAACGVLPNSRGKVRSPKGEGRPPR